MDPMQVLVIGGVAWNTIVFVNRFPDPSPHTVFASASHQAVGSSGAGKALNLRSLGAHVTLWALIGDDEAGANVRRHLDAAGVEFIAEIDPLGTAQHINLMDRDGERISIFANAGSLAADVDVAPVLPHIPDADMISVTIHDHCRPFLPHAAAAPAPVLVDIHDYDGENPHHDDFIDAADLLFMSSVSMDAWRPFLEARVAAGSTVAVATHGARGASGFSAAQGWVEIDAVPTDIVDTNGAGDAFTAGFAVSWYENADLGGAMDAGAEQAARALRSPNLSP